MIIPLTQGAILLVADLMQKEYTAALLEQAGYVPILQVLIVELSLSIAVVSKLY